MSSLKGNKVKLPQIDHQLAVSKINNLVTAESETDYG